MFRLVLAGAIALSMGGCATVTRGTTNKITVVSKPSGARAQTSMGYFCPATPCTFDVSRKAEFITTFTLDGYEPQEVPVHTKLADGGVAGFAGNVLVGGLVGMGVDASTGATLEHYPNPVFAELVPLAPKGGKSKKSFKPAVRKPEPVESASDAPEAPAS